VAGAPPARRIEERKCNVTQGFSTEKTRCPAALCVMGLVIAKSFQAEQKRLERVLYFAKLQVRVCLASTI
jgi:hypothetical protein